MAAAETVAPLKPYRGGEVFRPDVFRMAHCTETPDAELNVIDRGFAPYQPSALSIFATSLGPIESGKARIRWSRAATPSFSLLRDLERSLRGSPLTNNDVAHSDSQCCLFLWACCGNKRGKRFQQWIFSRGSPSAISSGILPRFECERGDIIRKHSDCHLRACEGSERRIVFYSNRQLEKWEGRPFSRFLQSSVRPFNEPFHDMEFHV
jgi:hypothetical protein